MEGHDRGECVLHRNWKLYCMMIPPYYAYPQRAALDAATGEDPYWTSVVLLAINDNKADTTTAFDDQSNTNHTLTANGNVQYDTAQAPTGMTSSGLFDGTGDYVSAADHADWDFGTADFTLEMMIRWNVVASVQSVLSNYSGWSFQRRGDAGDIATFYWGDAAQATRTWLPSVNTWYHYALSRSGTDLKFWVDGTQLGTTATNSTDITGATDILAIGRLGSLGIQYFDGWIANVRITKGVARYTANFTPPTLPLPTS